MTTPEIIELIRKQQAEDKEEMQSAKTATRFDYYNGKCGAARDLIRKILEAETHKE